MRKLLLKQKLMRVGTAMLFIMSAMLSMGQTITTTLATGTTTSTYVPIYGNYNYSYTQMLYLSTDFAVTTQGTNSLITKLRFFNTSGSLTNSTAWKIFMGQTNKTSFTTTTDWVPLTGLQTVFDGTLTAPAANTWMEITLTTPFQWDGISNVVVAIDENSGGYSNITWRKHDTGSNRTIQFYSDDTNPNPASPPTSNQRLSYVAQTEFVHQLASACTGTPAVANVSSNVNTICIGNDVTFTASNLAFANGYEYTWQHNSGAGWIDFPNSNSSVYTTNSLPQTSNVRVVVKCTDSNLSTESNDMTITVENIPAIAINFSDVAYCAGSPFALIASGATSYAWSPSTGLNNANTAIVNASPTASTIYTVTGSNAAGCSATATVKVKPLNAVKAKASYTPAELCTAGVPVQLTLSDLPVTLTDGGNWEYRFLSSNNTVLQDWSTSAVYNFTPPTDSLYTIFHQLRSSSCPTQRLDSVAIRIPVGFGAKAVIEDYNCNNLEGKIKLINDFGQLNVTEIYANDFTNPTNNQYLTFTGNAGFANGRAVITPSATSNSGSLSIDIPNFQAGSNNSMNVKFKMTADLPLNNYGTNGADGISYSFGNDAVVGGAGPLQNGKGSKLRLSFDAADNSPNITGIYLVYGHTATSAVTPTGTTTLAYSPNFSSWKNKTDVDVELNINTSGKVTVKIDGVTIFEDIQLPASYLTENISSWKHLFTAATGGDALRQAVSHFQISAGTMKYGITNGNVTTAPATWQDSKTFDHLTPGIYNIWLTKDPAGTCNKKVLTVEVLNTNPVVNLGNDTTICEGTSLLLDAGNPGATYVWSGTNIVTQTLNVTAAGSYIVYATNAGGCLGIGTINVHTTAAPTAGGIYSQGNYPSVYFSVLNPSNVDTYNWNFGDGSTVANAPSGINHSYAAPGTYTVTATISNGCGNVTLTKSITLTSTLSVTENAIAGLKVYPNPANEWLNISLDASTSASAMVYDLKGSLILSVDEFQSGTKINVINWDKGVYLIHISSEGTTSVSKIIVQ